MICSPRRVRCEWALVVVRSSDCTTLPRVVLMHVGRLWGLCSVACVQAPPWLEFASLSIQDWCRNAFLRLRLWSNHYIHIKLWVFLHLIVYRSSASTICTTIPVAAPPPLQIAAQPYSPFLSWCKSVTMILEPELPSAWPRAMAPPRGLTFEASRLRIWRVVLVCFDGMMCIFWVGIYLLVCLDDCCEGFVEFPDLHVLLLNACSGQCKRHNL